MQRLLIQVTTQTLDKRLVLARMAAVHRVDHVNPRAELLRVQAGLGEQLHQFATSQVRCGTPLRAELQAQALA
ncbi:hypothetical protein D3C75_1345530 [compost metagenome]